MTERFQLRYGKFGPYFHDRERGGKDGYDLPLEEVVKKLNRLEEYTQRLGAANRTRPPGIQEY